MQHYLSSNDRKKLDCSVIVGFKNWTAMCSNVAATAACIPKDIYIDIPKEQGQGSWLRKVRESGEFSNVSIVVENETFHLHMLPLSQESSHLKEMLGSRGVSKDQPPGSEMAIKLPNFPGGATVFAKAMDFCYGIDVRFSISNVAALMAASKYLGMDNLMRKAEDFLKRSVYTNWRNCLLLWAAIDHKDPYAMFKGRLNAVTKKCKRGFLFCFATKNEATGQLWCNIRDVQEVVALSSPSLASRVFQTLVDANVGLYYAVGESSDTVPSSILLYQPCPFPTSTSLQMDSNNVGGNQLWSGPPNRITDTLTWKCVCERAGGEAIQWLKALPSALPSKWQRTMFYQYIGEWLLQGMENQCGDSAPLVLDGFLLSLLVEATKLMAKSPSKAQFPSELMSVISRLRKFQSIWLLRVDMKWLANSVSRSELEHYSFEILQSVAKKIREAHRGFDQQQQQPSHGSHVLMHMKGIGGTSKEIFKENLARIDNPLFYAEKAAANFDECLQFQLAKKTLSVEEVLLLLQEFPSTLRNSHESLYRALEQVSKVRPLTTAELRDVDKMLDYRLVSDEVIKSAFRHPKFGFSHSLLTRAMELEVSNLDRVRLHYEQDDDRLSSREQLLRSRKCHLILEKALRTHMRASMQLSDRYRSLEEKVDAMSQSTSRINHS